MTATRYVQASHPGGEEPDGVVLRLWSDSGHIDLTEDDLDDLEGTLAWIRRWLSGGAIYADGDKPMAGIPIMETT